MISIQRIRKVFTSEEREFLRQFFRIIFKSSTEITALFRHKSEENTKSKYTLWFKVTQSNWFENLSRSAKKMAFSSTINKRHKDVKNYRDFDVCYIVSPEMHSRECLVVCFVLGKVSVNLIHKIEPHRLKLNRLKWWKLFHWNLRWITHETKRIINYFGEWAIIYSTLKVFGTSIASLQCLWIELHRFENGRKFCRIPNIK